MQKHVRRLLHQRHQPPMQYPVLISVLSSISALSSLSTLSGLSNLSSLSSQQRPMRQQLILHHVPFALS